MIWVIIILAIVFIFFHFGKAYRCPQCGADTDDSMHGFNHRQQHCHNCGWCTSSPNCKARKPEEFN